MWHISLSIPLQYCKMKEELGEAKDSLERANKSKVNTGFDLSRNGMHIQKVTRLLLLLGHTNEPVGMS